MEALGKIFMYFDVSVSTKIKWCKQLSVTFYGNKSWALKKHDGKSIIAFAVREDF